MKFFKICYNNSKNRTEVLNLRGMFIEVGGQRSEVWNLTENDKSALKSFEHKIFHKTYGPVREEGSWRKRNNNDLQALVHEKTQ